MSIEVTRNRFLGGRIIADQPKDGFRAGHDSVLLAAVVPARPGEHVLELGSGAGIASLCLAARVKGIRVTGVEIDPQLAGLANANAVLNGMAERVRFEAGDVAHFAAAEMFDHVFFNPPFHPESGHVSPDSARDLAKRDSGNIVGLWTRLAFKFVLSGGSITAILRADRADEMLAETDGQAFIFPLLPHAGEPPKRVIVRLTTSASRSRHVLPGLVLHDEDGRNTEGAEAVLRHGAALDLDIV